MENGWWQEEWGCPVYTPKCACSRYFQKLRKCTWPGNSWNETFSWMMKQFNRWVHLCLRKKKKVIKLKVMRELMWSPKGMRWTELLQRTLHILVTEIVCYSCKNLIIINEHIGKITYIKILARSFGHGAPLTLNSDVRSMRGVLERHWMGKQQTWVPVLSCCIIFLSRVLFTFFVNWEVEMGILKDLFHCDFLRSFVGDSSERKAEVSWAGITIGS